MRHASGFRLAGARVPDGPAKTTVLLAIEQARTQMPLRGVLRFLGISARRVQSWRRRQQACTLGDQSSCPRTSPQRLTHAEVQAIGDMVTAPAYRHVPTGRLALLAQRRGTVCASSSTWYGLVRRHRWRRPRVRVHPKTPTVGVRASRPDELWHIDTTVIRLLDGTRAYLHAVIDNYSRRILAWRVADRSTAANSVAVLLAASGQATSLEGTPDVLADGGVENVNAQVDALVQAGIVRRLLALTECSYSNSLIEAWWRSLKHQWLFLNALDSIATVRRLVAFYVDEHNRVIPHAALRGRTPDEIYFGAEGPEAAELPSLMAAARAARLQANRAACCPVCPALGAAG
ncbi:DDE-type integrase/transposase/recombinase [Luteitalea sp.]|uniref:DDE-type integrase/transposase/recombinase n=1 Tax=Luteitalea sp. TaxID=2004800 RepID=UPI0025C3986B|nr:DDE-type integrase/transposase/recombinase [Luteitalea sp.]